MICFGKEKMKTREDKRLVQKKKKKNLFGHILKIKFNTSTFWCIIIPLGPHSVYTFTPNEGFKGYVN